MREAYTLWRAARSAWLGEHPEVDAVDFIAAGRAERLRHRFPARRGGAR